ncbi:MAG: SAM-dependent methyltransferase [Parasphingorhabdus sp.]|jgi:SAM-dependent methyltransferase
MSKAPQGKLAQVTGKNVSIDPAEHYDDWAARYNDDLLNEYGYTAHKLATLALTRMLQDKSASIIDVGCGTGLVGLELAESGFKTIDGIDISKNMLAEAEKINVYRSLLWQDAEKDSVIDDGAYNAVISAGSFGKGHMGPDALGSLISMAVPNGLVVIFMNAEPFGDEDYASHIRQLEEGNKWVVVRIEDHNYMEALDRPGKLIIARRVRITS